MSASAATLPVQQWQIRFHETMAASLRTQGTVQQSGLFGIVRDLWRSAHDLKVLSAILKEISELPDGQVTEEFLQSQIPQLRELLDVLQEVVGAAKVKGHLNRSLTAAPLGLITARREYIADYLDGLEMSLDPAVVAAIKEGQEQIERGECEVAERLF
jgi:hypothetical protein